MPTALTTPLDRGLGSDAKLSFINLVRYRLNLSLPKGAVERWDLWAEGSAPFPLPDGKRAFLLSFRRAEDAEHEQGILVIGLLEGRMPVIVAQWKIPASIGDMHPVDMGPEVGVLLHVMSSGPAGPGHRMLYHHLLRLKNHRLEETWSARWTYTRGAPASYLPPVIRFVDTDGDGKKEILLRVPGAALSKRRSRRWAIFRWDGYSGRFVPKKGLAWSPVTIQKPTWTVSGFLEALHAQDGDVVGLLTAYPAPGCSRPEELVDFLANEDVEPAGLLRRSKASSANRAVVTVPMKKRSGPGRYLLEIQLRREQALLPRWKVCRLRLLRW